MKKERVRENCSIRLSKKKINKYFSIKTNYSEFYLYNACRLLELTHIRTRILTIALLFDIFIN